MARDIPNPSRFDKAFFEQNMAFLHFDNRWEMIDLMYTVRKMEPGQDPNLADIARRYYGKNVVDALEWPKRFALYRCIAWIWNDQLRILHHRNMRDHNILTNVYRTRLDVNGNPYDLYDDHKDWKLLTDVERNLLIMESREYYRRAKINNYKNPKLG